MGKTGSKTNDAINGLEEVIKHFGTPKTRTYHLRVDEAAYIWWNKITKERAGEVVLLIRRPNGKFLLHAKKFYPPGVYRVPTGGIHPGENLSTAIHREVQEETGLLVEIEQFLGIAHYEIEKNGAILHFVSYLFLLDEKGGELHSQDPEEQIIGYREISAEELPTIADSLENIQPDTWRSWGRFRAIAHRFAYELLTKGAS